MKMRNPNSLYPVGTVVMLKGGEKAIMIIGYAFIDTNNQNMVYDYCGCLYPEGIISSDEFLLFQHENIEKVLNLGYINDDAEVFLNELSSRLSHYIFEPITDNTSVIETLDS